MLENLQILQYKARKAREEVMATFLQIRMSPSRHYRNSGAVGKYNERDNTLTSAMSHQLLYPRRETTEEETEQGLYIGILTRNQNLRQYNSEITVEATRTAETYLGFWLDPALISSEHRKKMVAKAETSLVALRGLSGSTWGTSLLAMRKVYQAVVIPQVLYGVATWFQPEIMSAKESNNIVRQIASVQKRAAVVMGGAFRTTAMAALNVELYLSPMKAQRWSEW